MSNFENLSGEMFQPLNVEQSKFIKGGDGGDGCTTVIVTGMRDGTTQYDGTSQEADNE